MDNSRNGNFTSSEIVALTGFGKRDMNEVELAARPKSGSGSKSKTIEDIFSFDLAGLTYIEECNMERRLGRSLNNETSAKPTSWGNLLEKFVFADLPTSYRHFFDITKQHSEIPYWLGSPDVEQESISCVGDIKSPMTLKSFCQLVDPIYNGFTGIEAMNKVRENHKDGEKFYWQLISNSILLNCKYAELIIFVPYESQLDDVRDLAANTTEMEQNKVAWVGFANDNDMPYLIDGGYYQNKNIIRFEVPQIDRDFLKARVLQAGKLLITDPKLTTA